MNFFRKLVLRPFASKRAEIAKELTFRQIEVAYTQISQAGNIDLKIGTSLVMGSIMHRLSATREEIKRECDKINASLVEAKARCVQSLSDKDKDLILGGVYIYPEGLRILADQTTVLVNEYVDSNKKTVSFAPLHQSDFTGVLSFGLAHALSPFITE